MPSTPEILDGLRRIANDGFGFAIAWHALAGAFLVALSMRRRPPARVVGLLTTLPLASVAIFSFAFGNRFNGVSFALLAGVLAFAAARSRGEATQAPRSPIVWIGWFCIGLAWVYPHFLPGLPRLAYVIGSPMGLIPCPTLSLVMGLTLLGHAPRTRAWSLPLAAMGAFYGLFGIFRLDVPLDVGLLAGVAGLVARDLHDVASPSAGRALGGR
jgi:hypothetical protein